MKTLVLGSCCLDMIVSVDRIPMGGTDANAKDLSLNMGGMSYNVYQAITFSNEEAILGCPVGKGFFADIITNFYRQRNVEPFVVEESMDNGVCLCVVDKSGERTFMAYHGAEYNFKKEWYQNLNFDEIDLIYFTGLEVEEDTGKDLVSFLEEKQKPLLFAPSSRVVGIKDALLDRIYQLHPILHINEYEAECMSKSSNMEETAEILFEKTKAPVIITMGEKGAYIKTIDDVGMVETVPIQKEDIVDTIGAGDGHAGALIAGLKKGYSIRESVEYANKLAGTVLKHAGGGIIKQ